MSTALFADNNFLPTSCSLITYIFITLHNSSILTNMLKIHDVKSLIYILIVRVLDVVVYKCFRFHNFKRSLFEILFVRT